MYLYLDKKIAIREQDILAVFDLDNTTISKHTRAFLSRAEERGDVISIGNEIPRSFVVCLQNRRQKVYLTPLSGSAVYKRLSDESFVHNIDFTAEKTIGMLGGTP